MPKLCSKHIKSCFALHFSHCRFNTYNIDLKNKPSWYLEKTPGGKVPCVEVDGSIITESIVVSEYLEDKIPKPRLQANTPERRAEDKLIYGPIIDGVRICAFNVGEKFSHHFLLCSQIFPTVFRVIYTEDDKERAGYVKDLYSSMEGLEKILKGRKTKFFFGNDRPGLVDYMIWSCFERLEAMAKIRPGSEFPKEKLPTLVSMPAHFLTLENIFAQIYF